MNPIVEAADLSVRYGTKDAVRGLSFTLQPGETLGIVGPNGSGKTTALSCVEGLVSPASGSMRVFGADPVRQRREVYARMGVQLQDAAYPLRIRTAELCALYASFYAHPADWQTLLGDLGLAPMARRYVHTLSGGERQKLSVLLALMGQPQLLVLDELSTGLDPETRHSLRASLQQIASRGTAMIVVTHYLDELEGLAGRILLLEAGRQRFLGSLDGFRRWAGAESGKAASTLEEAYLSVCPPAATLRLEETS